MNPFFEPGVRIQTERGHHVIGIGPYARREFAAVMFTRSELSADLDEEIFVAFYELSSTSR